MPPKKAAKPHTTHGASSEAAASQTIPSAMRPKVPASQVVPPRQLAWNTSLPSGHGSSIFGALAQAPNKLPSAAGGATPRWR